MPAGRGPVPGMLTCGGRPITGRSPAGSATTGRLAGSFATGRLAGGGSTAGLSRSKTALSPPNVSGRALSGRLDETSAGPSSFSRSTVRRRASGAAHSPSNRIAFMLRSAMHAECAALLPPAKIGSRVHVSYQAPVAPTNLITWR